MRTRVQDRGGGTRHVCLMVFGLGASCIFNFSLAFCNRFFSEATLGLLKASGSFCTPIKIDIPFSWFDLGSLAFKALLSERS